MIFGNIFSEMRILYEMMMTMVYGGLYVKLLKLNFKFLSEKFSLNNLVVIMKVARFKTRFYIPVY